MQNAKIRKIAPPNGGAIVFFANGGSLLFGEDGLFAAHVLA